MGLTRRRRPAVCAALIAVALAGCGADEPVRDAATPPGSPSAAATTAPPTTPPPTTPPPTTPPPTTAPPTTAPPPTAAGVPDPGAVEVLVTGLRIPWGIDFLPDGDALVTERDTTRVLRIPAKGGAPQEVTRLEQAEPAGEGGVMGLALSPTFAQDNLVYVYLTAAQDNRIVRFRLDAPEQVEPVVTGIPKARVHNGGRIVFGPDRNLYAGTGDAGEPSRAQDDGSLGGKVLRMTPDGQPVSGGSLVFSKGHRNVQGIAFDADGRVYATEFGQNEWDEVNLLSQGTNGGWPTVEGPGTGGGRFLAPLVTWRPAEASPSGAAIAAGALYVAALRGERLYRVPIDGQGGLGEPEPLLTEDFGRLRSAVTAPDGSLWVLTSNRDGRADEVAADDDRILRLPAR
jgi:glucose/arabinose dehydrogenase